MHYSIEDKTKLKKLGQKFMDDYPLQRQKKTKKKRTAKRTANDLNTLNTNNGFDTKKNLVNHTSTV